MFGKSLKLFTLFGFEVRIDLSWLIIAFLVTWSLATGFFPHYYPGLETTLAWFMGVAGTLGLFFSILFHEFWHSLVARSLGLPMHGITLFLFGGVSEMHDEPPSARVEFLVAIAGPISSVVLGLFFLGLEQILSLINAPQPVSGVVGYLAIINWVVAAFNMLPAFPLDGGRVLRAILWKWRGDLRQATKIASKTGGFFGTLMIVFGVVAMLSGTIVGGIWYVVIGLFMRGTAQMAYRQLLISKGLQGRTVRRYMNDSPVTVGPDLTIRQLMQDYVYKYHYKMFPVVEDGRLAGCLSMKQLKGLDEQDWDRYLVRDFSSSCSLDNTISSSDDVLTALRRMQETGNSRLLVMDSGQLKGIIALKDILAFLHYGLGLQDTNLD
jgi:Zn-dependent protease